MNDDKLQKLISAWVDSAITEEEKNELSAALRDDADARQLYFQCMSVHAELCSLESTQDYLSSVSTLKTEPVVLDPPQSLGSWNVRRFAIGCGLLLAVAMGILAWTSVGSDANPSFAGADTQILERLVPLGDDCKWYVEHTSRTDANSYRADDVIRVTYGRLEVAYPHGTKIVLHAPAAFQLLSQMKARMLLGRLTATVTDAAKGFSVETPRATVVDLGTEFGVEVNNDGATDVVVFKGEVDVDYNDPSNKSNAQRLRMGEAVHLDAAGTASRLVSINGRSYSSETLQELSRPITIAEVHDNIKRKDPLMKYYDIVHQGMQEDALAFVDRIAHQWNGVDASGMPSYLLGADYVKMFNSDKYKQNIEISVRLGVPAKLYVLFDNRLPIPSWLREDFDDTGDDIGIDNGPFFSNGQWHKRKSEGIGPGESVEDVLSVWVKEMPEPGVYVLRATEVDLGTTLANMYGIAATPLETPVVQSSE